MRRADPVVTELNANHLYSAVKSAAASSRDERQFQSKSTEVIGEAATSLGIELESRAEYILATGRADAVYNRLVIEYEAPNSLRQFTGHARTAHAIQQAKDYIDGLVQREHHTRERVLGIVLDGLHMYVVRSAEGEWHVEHHDWSPAAAAELLRSLLRLRSGRALLPEYLIADFGSESKIAKDTIGALYASVSGGSTGLVSALFSQWQVFFAEVSGQGELAESTTQSSLDEFARSLGVTQSIDRAKFLFALHTYFCVLTKSIARLVLERYSVADAPVTPMSAVADFSSEDMQKEFVRVETGELYRALGLANLLEADFFGWYVHTWSPQIASSLSRLLRRLGDYDPATLEDDPFAARDLLKQLYHYLLPRSVRHGLGEYYTPDWLATRLLVSLNEPAFAPPQSDDASAGFGSRLLDPACGSGTFLILAIRHLKEHARRSGLSREATLDLVLRAVVGIDLNPLAVLAARVGYLLAIADLLPASHAIRIPVFLADSILLPSENADLFGRRRSLETVVGSLPFPHSVSDPEVLEQLAEELQASIEGAEPTGAFIDRAGGRFGLTENSDREALTQLHTRLLELHAERRDGIWARVLKNALMPLLLGRFDYVVGNPPWVNWESLPENYRERTRPLWRKYQLTGQSGKLGSVRVDVSVLMTYAVADIFLKSGGKLGFLITQSVFKSAAGAGFRRFELPDTPLEVLHVDDLTELQPFEGASNRTSAFILRKGRPTRYPIVYTYWRKTNGSGSFSYNSTLTQVLAATERLELRATPVDRDDASSLWLTARPRAIMVVRDKLLGPSEYKAHAGVCTWANGIYWVEVIRRTRDGMALVRNAAGSGKRTVPQVEAEVELDLLHPLVRPGDIRGWEVRPTLYQLLPYDLASPRKAIPTAELAKRFPGAHDYFQSFEAILTSRAGYKQLLKARGEPYYAVMDIASYSFASYKVVWARIASDVRAGTATGRAVPQETVTLVPVQSEREAHFLTGMINSTPFKFAAAAYSMRGGKSFAGPHLLENIRVPSFSNGNADHMRVASVVATQLQEGKRDQGELDHAAAAAWGLDSESQRQIEKSYLEQSPGAALE